MLKRRKKKVNHGRTAVINGELFYCMMADIDVLERLVSLHSSLEAVREEDARGVIEAVRMVLGLIDEMLGAGAWARIFSSERVVNLHDALGVMGDIALQLMGVNDDQ